MKTPQVSRLLIPLDSGMQRQGDFSKALIKEQIIWLSNIKRGKIGFSSFHQAKGEAFKMLLL